MVFRARRFSSSSLRLHTETAISFGSSCRSIGGYSVLLLLLSCDQNRKLPSQPPIRLMRCLPRDQGWIHRSLPSPKASMGNHGVDITHPKCGQSILQAGSQCFCATDGTFDNTNFMKQKTKAHYFKFNRKETSTLHCQQRRLTPNASINKRDIQQHTQLTKPKLATPAKTTPALKGHETSYAKRSLF